MSDYQCNRMLEYNANPTLQSVATLVMLVAAFSNMERRNCACLQALGNQF
jgi:hypothetical protein